MTDQTAIATVEQPATLTREFVKTQGAACILSPHHFIHNYCQIYDALAGGWIPFRLWNDQVTALQAFATRQQVIALKSRQIGMTWLCLAYALWMMLFRPASTVLMFSRRDDEAMFLLGDQKNKEGDSRLRGIFHHLPNWMRNDLYVGTDSAHEWALSNGSVARAFPTTAGDSYTGSLVIIDEADLVPNLNALMRSTKPTIDAGGKMVLVSRSDKSQPNSEFKRLYKSAKKRGSTWHPLFFSWRSRPDRTQAWYDRIKAEILGRTGSLDDLHEQYPATDVEALNPNSQDKRIPADFVNRCYEETEPLNDDAVYEFMFRVPETDAEEPEGTKQSWREETYRQAVDTVSLVLPSLQVYEFPIEGEEYVLGADPAEGNPQSDESASTVLHRVSGRQVAVLAGLYEPGVFASYIAALCSFFNDAQAMVERNNHGHAVLLWLRDNSSTTIMYGHDGKHGWATTSLSKSLLYEKAVETLREHDATIRDAETAFQLQSIEAGSMSAPANMNDDRATCFVLANIGRVKQGSGIYV